jgi:Domain of unknown function (DUF1814).
MNSLIKSILPDPVPKTTTGMVNAVREIMQSLALLGLWRAKFFEHAAFYGGTSLRILYGLDRFSEDLDFSLLKPSSDFNFSIYSDALQNELEAYGFEVTFDVRHKTAGTAVESAFLKGNTYNQLIVIKAPEQILSGVNRQSVLKVKLEVDTNPPRGFSTEMKYVFSPIQFAVRSYTLPSLFAGKVHALLFRKWKSRIKGRDWYDFIWYTSRYPVLSLSHLEERMRQSGHYTGDTPLSLGILKELIGNAIDVLNIDEARKEVIPFVADVRGLDIWSREFFRAAAERIMEERGDGGTVSSR